MFRHVHNIEFLETDFEIAGVDIQHINTQDAFVKMMKGVTTGNYLHRYLVRLNDAYMDGFEMNIHLRHHNKIIYLNHFETHPKGKRNNFFIIDNSKKVIHYYYGCDDVGCEYQDWSSSWRNKGYTLHELDMQSIEEKLHVIANELRLKNEAPASSVRARLSPTRVSNSMSSRRSTGRVAVIPGPTRNLSAQ